MSFILGQTCAPAKLVVCLLFMQWWTERCLLSCAACIVCAVQIRQRVSQILSIRGGSVKAIKSIMRGKTLWLCVNRHHIEIVLLTYLRPFLLCRASAHLPWCYQYTLPYFEWICGTSHSIHQYMIHSRSQDFHYGGAPVQCTLCCNHRPQYIAYPLKLTTHTPAFRQ